MAEYRPQFTDLATEFILSLPKRRQRRAMTQARQLARVTAQIGMAFRFQRAEKRHAGCLSDLAHQGAAHAARGARHDDVEIGHAR